jgi:hypothetical protein
MIWGYASTKRLRTAALQDLIDPNIVLLYEWEIACLYLLISVISFSLFNLIILSSFRYTKIDIAYSVQYTMFVIKVIKPQLMFYSFFFIFQTWNMNFGFVNYF